MTWKNTWNGSKRKVLPNKFSKKPTISFRSDLRPETLKHVKKLSEANLKSDFINKAIEMKYFHDQHKKAFLIQMIQSNYTFCKHILRQIGHVFNKNNPKIEKEEITIDG